MINLCTDPTCDDTAAMSVQRQGDVAPVVYCLTHGYQRENELRQKLENFQTVVLERPASELEQALARVQELEEELTEPNASTVDGAGAGQLGDGSSTAEQLATTLHTLETQARALASARSELADREQALQVMRRELERTRAELERARAALATAKTTPAPASEPPAVPPITPPPPTRPDASKP